MYMAESTNTKDEVHPRDVLIGYWSESGPLWISPICPTRKSLLFGHHSSLFGQDGWTYPFFFCFSIYLELLFHKNAKKKRDMDHI